MEDPENSHRESPEYSHRESPVESTARGELEEDAQLLLEDSDGSANGATEQERNEVRPQESEMLAEGELGRCETWVSRRGCLTGGSRTWGG